MSRQTSEPVPAVIPDDTLHYHFGISLRVRHPEADPERITNALRITPKRAWKAGAPRQTPVGTPLQGVNPATYWTVPVLAGRYPKSDLCAGIHDILDRLTIFRDFYHTFRPEGGSVELLIGWFFERQSGDVLRFDTLTKAADLQVDLSLDVYPPSQPQSEYEVDEGVLPR